ncbi:MAG: hypothetical protein IJN87_09245 [Firmicutes bacterium]|nr:hypothetical protein [Bacillota bacterium]
MKYKMSLDSMCKALTAAGISQEQLAELNAQQLIVVISAGDRAEVSMYEFDGDDWQDLGLTYQGFVGKYGVSREAREGANMTPFGLYPVGEAFYFNEKPVTGLDCFAVTPDTYWVDDPESRFYNMHREGTTDKDWNSAEHMIDYPYHYEYGFVIKYNMDPIVPGRGSAIFFHINDKCTAGCVAVSRVECLAYLKALDKDKKPYILMV